MVNIPPECRAVIEIVRLSEEIQRPPNVICLYISAIAANITASTISVNDVIALVLIVICGASDKLPIVGTAPVGEVLVRDVVHGAEIIGARASDAQCKKKKHKHQRRGQPPREHLNLHDNVVIVYPPPRIRSQGKSSHPVLMRPKIVARDDEVGWHAGGAGLAAAGEQGYPIIPITEIILPVVFSRR